MKNKIRKAVMAATITALAVPAAAAAADLDAFALAAVETEQQNMAWYADVDTDALSNESCREDLAPPVFQPEIDTTRLKVTGDFTAAGNITCADVQLASNATIVGYMSLEYRDTSGVWREKSAARRDLRGSMVNGAGQAHGVVRYTFAYDEVGVDRPLRVCIKTQAPDPSYVRCMNAGAATKVSTN